MAISNTLESGQYCQHRQFTDNGENKISTLKRKKKETKTERRYKKEQNWVLLCLQNWFYIISNFLTSQINCMFFENTKRLEQLQVAANPNLATKVPIHVLASQRKRKLIDIRVCYSIPEFVTGYPSLLLDIRGCSESKWPGTAAPALMGLTCALTHARSVDRFSPSKSMTSSGTTRRQRPRSG